MLASERLDVVVSRQKYLSRIFEFRSAGYEVFYEDKTWCNVNHTTEYMWQNKGGDKNFFISDTKCKGGLSAPTGSGIRVIIYHVIGSIKGFLESCR